METRKDWWKNSVIYQNLSAKLHGFEWRWDRRSEWDPPEIGLLKLLGLDVLWLSPVYARQTRTMDTIFRLSRDHGRLWKRWRF